MSCEDLSEAFSYESDIQEKYREKIEAHAFRSLCRHLQERSDLVSNMDLMSTGGFCRNCLAKWLVLAARDVSEQIQERKTPKTSHDLSTINTLDSFEYKKAAKVVYGCSYDEWKSRHFKKASGDEMKRYEESMIIHAKHNDELLKPRERPKSMQTSLWSNVCCQDMEESSTLLTNTGTVEQHLGERTVDPIPSNNTIAPDISSSLMLSSRLSTLKTFSVGIMTVSDRAASNSYKNGDLSGPAVEQSLKAIIQTLNENNSQKLSFKINQRAIVPDDPVKIVETLTSWSDGDDFHSPVIQPCDIILSTGGSGFSPRDQTPEATAKVLDMECRGLMTWVYSECTKRQPLACLSRGTAGVRKRTLIANLPGNPQGVHEVMVILIPLLLHALKDMRDNVQP